MTGVAGHAVLAGEVDHHRSGDRAARDAALPHGRPCPLDHLAARQVEIAGGRTRPRRNEPGQTATRDRAALVAERGLGDGPPTVELADHPVGGDPHLVEEHLAELGAAVHLRERPRLDAGLIHVDHEVRHPAVLGLVGIGAGQQHPELRDVGRRVPHLLPGDDPLVAVAHRPRPDARQVGTRARVH